MAHYSLYTAGSRIWIQDKETWKGAVVQTDYDGKSLSFKLDDGGTLQVVNSTPAQLPPLRNPDILIGLNDLTTLSYLHEPGVLFNLKYRFTEMKTIYTYCGIVLVAINPYQKLGIYGVETMWTYRGHAIGELEPHVFAVAEEAFKEMERASLNQSIIVSGESGAGKTVSAKYAMRYFATVGGAESVTSIERKVLASQPIMEAIGNAKTTRNDNSSRFGKYVELQFSSAYSIIGASMRTYLLEKSRVVFQAPGERNYHIFYQILTSEDDEVSDLSLGSTKFNYTKTMSIKGVNDASQFTDTVQSMKLLGFGIDDRRNYFKLLAGILHLGNIVFKLKDEGCVIEMPSPPLMVLSSLLSISASELTKWLTFRRIRSAHEEFLKPMTVSEAEFSRDALAKLMYDLSFNWIVKRVNETLKSDEECFKFIGVLDIYGFETFEINSFEQFCINYANEKLQQQFNSHMFKLDQEEYAKESIEWTFIDFYDNQPCIDLIETKLGILSLLDEETRMPAANDKSWTMKLYKECGKYAHFKTPKRADGEDFTIVHFASEVKYTSSGFLEKNRDTVLADQIQTVKNSTNPFIASIISIDETTVATVARKKTVSTQFRSSLSSLMTSLNSTTPHYIRCIKPNDDKVPFQFEDSRALQQLRACGVLETVRIQASGFPTRWTYVDFAKRYRVLCKSTEIKRNDIKGTSIGILTRHITDSSTYKLGTTKIFFRSGVLAYLEKLRSAKLQICIQRIQKTVRGWLARRRYAKIKKSCALLQRYGRGYLARRQFMLMKQTAAAITIQKYTRMYIVRREYTTLRTLISKLQTHCRMRLAIQKAQRLRVERATIIIQKNIRMYLVRKRYQEIRRGIILLQSCTRRILAKRELKALKLEARSLEHVKQLNKGLENKIIELQLRIEAQAKVMIKSDQMAAELVTSKAQLTGLKQLETKYKQAEKTIESHVAAIQKLESSLRTETDEKVDLIYRNKKLEGDCTDLKQRIGRLEAENQRMEDEVKKLMQQLIGFNNLKNDFETLERERDEERMAHQGMAPKKNPPVPAPRAKATPTDAFVNTLQIENALLKKKLDESTLDVLKLHDLEMQNEQAQANYRNLLLSNSPTEDVRKQVKEQGEELALKREENLMLRSLLSSGNSDREIITTLEQQLTAEKLNVKHLLEENKRLRGYAGGKDDESVYETAAYELNTNRVNNQSPYSGSVAQLLPRRELPAPENYTGLLQYDPTAEHRILKSILVDLKPTVALSLDPPTLPAFIIFMMIKYIDSLNDETRLQPLFKNFVKMLNKVIQKRNQLEYNFLWLSNVLRLLHNLKQYSGESAFVRENTPKQNDQCLINFDLIEFRQGLSDLGLRFYVALIKNFEDQVQPLIVPALLESSPELTSTIINKSKDKSKPMDILTRELSANYDLLVQFQMDLEVITQIFKQLFYYLTAASMNNLLLRKDLCNWSNGIQIRYNISQLEEWCRNKSLDSIIPILQPIIQASRLLQANKSEKDVDNVCEMCDELTVGQVIKILHLFTADEEELRVSSSFIKKVQLKLSTRKVGPETSQQLLMDTKHLLPVKFPYHPSSIKLDELNIPEALGLAELVTKL